MNYKLAKKLKDAGFSQKGGKSHEAYYLNAGEVTGIVDYDMYNQVDDGFRKMKLIYIPTLSELIEACGERYFKLEFMGKWVATSTHITLRQLIDGEGSTPEEAIANLWLKLKQIKDEN